MPSSRSLLALTAVSVNMEMVLLVTGLSNGRSALVAATVLVAFHIGYLVADRLTRCRPSSLALASTVGFGGTTLGLVLDRWPLAVPFVVVASSAVQGLRRQLKGLSRISPTVKNSVKLGAMAAGGIGATPVGLVALGIAWMLGAGHSHKAARPVAAHQQSDLPRVRGARWLLATEFLHHAHYFTYCYTLWRLLPQVPVAAIGALFVVGWLAYFVAESLVGSRRHYSLTILAIGHVTCGACLLVMAHPSGAVFTMLLWFCTGVGGGTAYMLSNGPQPRRRELAEDVGHSVGTLVGGALATLVSTTASLRVAAVLALATAFTSMSANVQINRDRRRSKCDS